MSYRIRITPEARREIKSLPGYVRAQALQLIDALTANPRPQRAKELRDKRNLYRIWLAKGWRIVFEVDDELELVIILRVRQKKSIDYESL